MNTELLRQEVEAARWIVAVGSLHEASWLPILQRSTAPLLVVVSDQRHAEALEQEIDSGADSLLELRVEWLAAQAGEAAWFTYNDSRRNGPFPPEHWQARYPNLRLEGMALRQQISLEQLLADWPPAQADEGLLLWCGSEIDPLLCTPALSRCRALAATHDAPEALSESLSTCFLKRVPAAHGLWQRDATAFLKATLLAERDQLQAANAELTQERDELKQRMQAINQELDQILALIETTESVPLDG